VPLVPRGLHLGNETEIIYRLDHGTLNAAILAEELLVAH
jgi:hypothetical protein